MTLPYPDSPDLNENIGTSIARIKDNLDYLDGQIGVFQMKHFLSTSINIDNRSGLVAVAGIGFLPKGCTIWAIDRTGNSSSFGSATTSGNSCVYQSYTQLQDSSSSKSLYLEQSSGNVITAELDSFSSGQAIFNWEKEGTPTGSVMDVIYIFFS